MLGCGGGKGGGMGCVQEGKESCGVCEEVWGMCGRVYGVSLGKCVGEGGEKYGAYEGRGDLGV